MLDFPVSQFEIELWNNGVRSATLSGLAQDRAFTQSRNEAETIDWSIPTELINQYAERHKVNARSLIVPKQTRVKIKYGGIAVVGGEVYYAETVLGDPMMTNIKASGFLDLYKDRFVEGLRSYAAVNGPDIAKDLLVYTQGFGTNWNYGTTYGTMPTVGPITRDYDSINIKDAIKELTTVANYPFDFAFTPDNVFQAYRAIGSQRPDVKFTYPGNILDGSKFPLDAGSLANRMIVYGSGVSAQAAPPVFRDDTNSQINFKVRQKKLVQNDINVTATLQDMGDAQLQALAFPLDVPTLQVDGNQAPYLTDYGIGDYVKLIVKDNAFIERTGMFRVEKRDVKVDNNDRIDITNYLS